MELYLDSADFLEIKEAVQYPFITGLNTSPAFINASGSRDADDLLMRLGKMCPVIHIEATGENSNEITHEAHRILNLGLDPSTTVFKIPVSLEGAKACKLLTDEGIQVNMNMISSLQQAYIAMQSNTTYLSLFVGSLQDQGQDAITLVEQCVEVVNYYGYPTRIMFGGVRNPEHVRNALNAGASAISVSWSVMRALTENSYTTQGTRQLMASTRMLTLRVKDVMRKINPVVSLSDTILEAVVEMSRGGMGAVTVLDNEKKIAGVFTDGDLRRQLESNGKDILSKRLSELLFRKPATIESSAFLQEAADILHQRRIDNILVVEEGNLIGMLDIQDLN